MKDKIWTEISADAKTLIKLMLKFDYTQRCTARQALENKWFENAPEAELNDDLMKEALNNFISFNAV
jgi:uncharacterized membrane protein